MARPFQGERNQAPRSITTATATTRPRQTTLALRPAVEPPGTSTNTSCNCNCNCCRRGRCSGSGVREYDKHGNELAALKWPLTRLERIHELDLMLNEYADTPQVENILATRAWHLRFPLDEYVAKERVSFQRGRKIEEGELGGGLIWIEGAPEVDF